MALTVKSLTEALTQATTNMKWEVLKGMSDKVSEERTFAAQAEIEEVKSELENYITEGALLGLTADAETVATLKYFAYEAFRNQQRKKDIAFQILKHIGNQ